MLITFFLGVHKEDVSVALVGIQKVEACLELVNLSRFHQPLVRDVLEVLRLHKLQLLWCALFLFGCLHMLSILHPGANHVEVELIRVPVEGSLVERLEGRLLFIEIPVFDQIPIKPQSKLFILMCI